jgi:metallophosphoesterase (TIGR03767 family)
MGDVGRRRFLRGSAAALAAAGWAPGWWTPAQARQLRRATALAASPGGTTLESTVAVVGADPSGYVRLGPGPGWPTVVRTELAEAQAGREDRRVALASIGHLTDIHLVDCQSPGRVEFTDRFGSPFESAQRPQETMSTQVGAAMIERLNALAGGPISGRPLDCIVSTGDSIDNQQHNELAWFMTLLDGGSLVPDSGLLGTYEGVQDAVPGSFDPHYWHPDPGLPTDDYKLLGFPVLPGLLDAVLVPFDVPGVRAPWYSTYGNHDGLVQGNVNGVTLGVRQFDPVLTGSAKPIDFAAVPSPTQLQGFVADPGALLGLAGQAGVPVRTVTADPARRAVAPSEWVDAHLASPTGPHGFTEAHRTATNLDFTFPVAPGVLGISLDTVNHGGYADGSVGAAQLAWLDGQLAAAAGQLVVLFSHHNLGTIENTVPDPANPTDPRMGRDALLAVLRTHPNLIAWVNGHTHVNRVNAVPDPTGVTGGFWEITTAAHIDYPEQSRVVEVVDNADGTLSIFGTVLEHAGPAAAVAGDRSVLGLASLSRELAANDPQTDRLGKLGAATDLNVELLLRAPFDLTGLGRGALPASGTTAPGAGAGGSRLPATGGGTAGLAIGGAALAAAVALRQRRPAGSELPATRPDGAPEGPPRSS